MTNRVTVTHDWEDEIDFDSDSVEVVAYNANDNSLYVVWQDSSRVYRFNAVPFNRVEQAVTAPSVGRAVANLKTDFGPSTYVGDMAYVWFEKVPSNVVTGNFVTANDGTPSDSTKEFSLAEVPVQSGNPGLSVASDSYTYELFFDLDGNEKSHTITGKSTLDEALSSLNDAAEALGVPIVVKKAVVEFV